MSIDPRSASADDLLQALTVAELAPDDPRVAARFAQDPQLRTRWQAIAATLAELQLLDSGMQGDGAAATPRAGTPAGVRGLRGGAPGRWWLVAAVFAALLLVGWALLSRDVTAPDPRLGPGDAPGGLERNGGRWPAGAPLRWPAVPRAAGYRLQIQSTDGKLLLELPAEHGEWLTQNSWLPTPEQRAALPEQFQWRVLAFDSSNEPLPPSAWTNARR